MRLSLCGAALLAMISTGAFAEQYYCAFASNAKQVPTDLTFVLSDTSDRALIDDSVRRPLDRGRKFAQIDSDTNHRIRLKWRFKSVPRAMHRTFAHPAPGNDVDYQLTINKSDLSAVVVVTHYVVYGQPELTRAQGSCRRV